MDRFGKYRSNIGRISGRKGQLYSIILRFGILKPPRRAIHQGRHFYRSKCFSFQPFLVRDLPRSQPLNEQVSSSLPEAYSGRLQCRRR